MVKVDYGDPAQIVEWRQSLTCAGCKNEDEVFGRTVCALDRRHGKRCKRYEEREAMSKCPEHVRQAMHEWGAWARRPQFWANLKVRSIYSALPIPGQKTTVREIRLSPVAARLHRCVMAIECERTKGVLYAYYVRGVVFDDAPDVFQGAGISRRTFYRMVADGSIRAFNASKIA